MLIHCLAVVVVLQSFSILSLGQLASPPTSAGIPRWYVPNGGGAITRFDKNNAVWFAYSNGVARHGATGGLSKYPSGGGILALTVGPTTRYGLTVWDTTFIASPRTAPSPTSTGSPG